jgi:zinc transport system substrate-binding protein
MPRQVYPLIFMAALALCGAAAAQAKPKAIVPIAPMAWLLHEIAGDDLEIITLIPAGFSPHTFEVSPRQMVELSQAGIFFTLNMPPERRLLQKIAANSPSMRVIDLNQGIALHYFDAQEEGHGESGAVSEPDPHTWLNPENAIQQAAVMAAALRGFGREQQRYDHNFEVLAAKLRQLDASLQISLRPFAGQKFLVYHPSFGYLARRYGLRQIALEEEGKEPTPRHLARLLEQARKLGIKIIFTQPQFPRAQAERLAQAIGGKVVTLDPLAYDYLDAMGKIAEQLSEGF